MNKFNNSQNEMYVKVQDLKPISDNRGAAKQENAGKDSWPSSTGDSKNTSGNDNA